MNTPDSLGQAMHSDDEEGRRQAARLLGKARTERKVAAARENGKKGGTHVVTEEMKARISASQKARWERKRQEAGEVAKPVAPQPTEKRPAGRPRTRPIPDPDTPKKPVGRPRKQEAIQMTLPDTETPETGAQRQEEAS